MPPVPHRRRVFAIAALLVAALLAAVPSGDAIAQLPVPAEEPITPVPAPLALDPGRVALGAALFDDPDLSGSRGRSCASCHDLATNGADPRRFDPGLDGRPLPMNTNTVFDAALSFRQNWEGTARSLEEQADGTIRAPGFMAGDPGRVLRRLGADPTMAARFRAAYGRAPSWPDLLDAIATFERTLLTPDSRFDRWLRGDRAALAPTELDGYELFKRIGCASCHQGVNVGGNLFERFGVVDPEFGRQGRMFRVPGLRNVATSPPYFDDGSAPTLGAAVHRMASAQLGRALSDPDADAIVAFLRTLTGRYRGRDLSAPR